MGIPAVIAAFLYYENHSLADKLSTANASLQIEQENIRVLKSNIQKVQDAHDVTLKTVDMLRKDNELSKKIVIDLNQKSQSDTNLIDYLVKNIDKKDDKPATAALKGAVLSTKEQTK